MRQSRAGGQTCGTYKTVKALIHARLAPVQGVGPVGLVIVGVGIIFVKSSLVVLHLCARQRESSLLTTYWPIDIGGAHATKWGCALLSFPAQETRPKTETRAIPGRKTFTLVPRNTFSPKMAAANAHF